MKKYIVASTLAFIIILSSGLFFYIFPYYTFLHTTFDVSPYTLLTDKTHANDQVNVLLLGIAGGSHDGPNLSDSIIVAHYDFKTNHLSTIGIPRDIWSDTLQDKINSAYAYGEDRQKGTGLTLAKSEISALLNIPIQYGLVIDFQKFKNFITFLGGVDVNVKNEFTDYYYPIEGKENTICEDNLGDTCRYETITFKNGLQHMDAVTALKFARSRHADGEEGTDFARNQRQQLILKAVKTKLISMIEKHDIKTISNLYEEINNVVTRDMPNKEIAYIAKNMVSKQNFIEQNISLPLTMFYESLYDGRFILLPINNNYTALHTYVSCSLDKGADCSL